MKVAYYAKRPIRTYDPANIMYASSANVIRNIYSSLIEFDRDGNLRTGIAPFSWTSEREIRFNFQNAHQTIEQKKITAEDAYLTFKRLIIKQSNTHGNLRSFLCPNHVMKSISDDCPGLKFTDIELILTIQDIKTAKFLLPLLASMDFSIIPKSAINWKDSSLPIIDYKNTSGPYYLEQDSDIGEFHFKANPYHYNFNEKIAKDIFFIRTEGDKSIEMFKNNQIDLITTVDPSPKHLILNLANSSDANANLFKTAEIQLLSLTFTPKSFRNLTSKERLTLGFKVKALTKQAADLSSIYKSTNEFFPVFGEASLSNEKKLEIESMWQKASEIREPVKPLTISVLKDDLEFYKKLFASERQINIVPFAGDPRLKNEKDQEDAYILPGDTGFFENISLISYYLNIGITPMSREQATQWIENYMAIEDKEARLNKLRDLHFEILKNIYVVPIGIAPYLAAARKPWKPSLYKFFAGTPLWMIERED